VVSCGCLRPPITERPSQLGGFKTDDAQRLKELKREISTLNRLLADAELSKAALMETAADF
jgi:hypothetical protein